jgi:hypothetical protein
MSVGIDLNSFESKTKLGEAKRDRRMLEVFGKPPCVAIFGKANPAEEAWCRFVSILGGKTLVGPP